MVTSQRPPSHRGPARWKVALITWLGLYPTVLLVSLLLSSLTESWPLALRLLVVTALVVPLMVYVVTPALTRLLAGWLRR